MKTNSAKKHSGFQITMMIIIPLIVLLLIASLAMLGAMFVTHNFSADGILSPGNIVIVMALCSAALAIIGVIFSFATAGKEPEEDDEFDVEKYKNT